MQEITRWMPPEGAERAWEADSYRSFLRLKILLDGPRTLRAPAQAVRDWPEWQRDALPVLVAQEAEKRGLKVAKSGTDEAHDQIVFVLEPA